MTAVRFALTYGLLPLAVSFAFACAIGKLIRGPR